MLNDPFRMYFFNHGIGRMMAIVFHRVNYGLFVCVRLQSNTSRINDELTTTHIDSPRGMSVTTAY